LYCPSLLPLRAKKGQNYPTHKINNNNNNKMTKKKSENKKEKIERQKKGKNNK
jgi:hypothetical protein